ncbi:aldo/keto reductase, partial [Rhizobium johnstonii]
MHVGCGYPHEEEEMDYRKLGPSGTVVTAYCLGTMTFGA